MRGARTRRNYPGAGSTSRRKWVYNGGKIVKENIFDTLLSKPSLFLNKEILHHSHRPTVMPHREKEIERIAFNLVEALNGQIPSNMILYGVTGAGKTAVTLHVTNLLKEKGEQMRRDITPVMVNCRQIDTQYRVLSNIGNSLLEEHEIDEIPFTGWPTDRVFKELIKRMDARKGVFVIVLDEIDHLVRKAGDDLLYNLTNINSFLKDSRACVIGISNDLKFTEFLDPRVRSRLGQQDLLFAPYDAEQLKDILRKRASVAIAPDVVSEGVIALCSAFAAQEHGDARCALDLLRVSTEKAEQLGDSEVEQHHVRMAQHQIEADQIEPVIAALPTQQKLVLASVLINERNGLKNIQTGQLYDVYDQACSYLNIPSLTQRRISGIIANLDMLGLITARTISRGRYGRSKEINSCIPQNVETQQILMNADENMSTVFNNRYRQQRPL